LFIWMKINELMELITWMMIFSSTRLIWLMLNVIHVAKVLLKWFTSSNMFSFIHISFSFHKVHFHPCDIFKISLELSSIKCLSSLLAKIVQNGLYFLEIGKWMKNGINWKGLKSSLFVYFLYDPQKSN
jgi:hypothetical protein